MRIIQRRHGTTVGIFALNVNLASKEVRLLWVGRLLKREDINDDEEYEEFYQKKKKNSFLMIIMSSWVIYYVVNVMSSLIYWRIHTDVEELCLTSNLYRPPFDNKEWESELTWIIPAVILKNIILRQ